MRKIVLAALTLTAAGCATDGGPRPGHGRPPTGFEGRCSADRLGRFIGQEATPALVARAKARSGASVARVLMPGQVTTLEYRVGRLNVHVDERNRVQNFNCG